MDEETVRGQDRGRLAPAPEGRPEFPRLATFIYSPFIFRLWLRERSTFTAHPRRVLKRVGPGGKAQTVGRAHSDIQTTLPCLTRRSVDVVAEAEYGTHRHRISSR